MKNHRFLWLRNRTTDNRKCEKARNIKEKRTIEMFSTVSKPQDVLLSFQRDNKKTYNRIPEVPAPDACHPASAGRLHGSHICRVNDTPL